ncbi:uncharacterized protein LOC106528507 isoform X2 [Austrofundulus limnaeus]|uniref:Uncharacterized protein LOC106528507 isoform X2 n=1 Tax=Austrofundulus limnaeus TaxID=52670 RepID=A0A2I4CGM7_AUSLI|nr:PREDICTED: uncharacterized protein LOC106528507 isoform X2 [Austrofundulus limnaeus]
MRRQQLKQRLDVEEEERSEDFRPADDQDLISQLHLSGEGRKCVSRCGFSSMDQCEDREEGAPHCRTTQRSRPGPEPSCVSFRRDWSKDHLLVNVNKQSLKTVIHWHRADDPEPDLSCLSFNQQSTSAMKRVEQQNSEGPSAQSAQQHQTQLDSVFMLLEDKILTFVKTELRKIQKVLSSNHSRCLFSQMAHEDGLDVEADEKRCNREAFLHITLHFLRKMKQEELADRLQSKSPEPHPRHGRASDRFPEFRLQRGRIHGRPPELHLLGGQDHSRPPELSAPLQMCLGPS